MRISSTGISMGLRVLSFSQFFNKETYIPLLFLNNFPIELSFQSPAQKYKPSFMNLPKPLPTFQIEQIDIIGPFRRAKHNRNISLPDLKDQNPSKSQTKRGYQHNLKYNKWYIKPQQRLKQNYHNRHQSSYTQFKEDFVYQNLYHTQEHTKRQGVQNSTMRLRSSCIDQLCADSGNLKILNKYKNKKQTVSKRVPGVVHFLLRFNKNKENERKEGHLKRKKIAV